jgi:hypothetical protein
MGKDTAASATKELTGIRYTDSFWKTTRVLRSNVPFALLRLCTVASLFFWIQSMHETIESQWENSENLITIAIYIDVDSNDNTRKSKLHDQSESESSFQGLRACVPSPI